MTLPPRCGQDAALLQQTQDQHWNRQKKSHHYRQESVFGLAHYCYIMAHVNVYITLNVTYCIHLTHYIHTPAGALVWLESYYICAYG